MLAHGRAGRRAVTCCPYRQVQGPAASLQIGGTTLSDEAPQREHAQSRRYARQPGRPDDWLAPRRTGCSASGHSPQPNGAASALDLPMSAHTRRNGPGCRSTRRSVVAAIRSATRPGFTSGPRGAAPRPRLRSMRRPALSDRRQGKSSSSAAGRLRSDAAGTSPSAISLAEHRVEFGVAPNLPDLLRAAAGDGDLGSPMQRLLA